MNQVLHSDERDDGIIVLTFDDPANDVNTLRAELAREFGDWLHSVERRGDIAGVVIRSGKRDSFIAGADLEMLSQLTSAEQGRQLSQLSQRIQSRIESLPFPVVAAIHGVALGGGLELALACDARVASDDRVTRLGLPEVRLGLLPGGGGTWRTPRLIGLAGALNLLLSGRQLNARQAERMGLVDRVVTHEHLLQASLATLRDLAAGRRLSSRPLAGVYSRRWWQHVLMARNPVGRGVVFARARKQVLKRTGGHYPAPLKILEVLRRGLAEGEQSALEAEAKAFGELTVDPVAKRLVGLFFATTALKKDSGCDHRDVVPRPVRRITVIGAGLMGAGIAEVSAQHAKLEVMLKDREPQYVEKALSALAARLQRKLARHSLSADDVAQVKSRIVVARDAQAFAESDVVIEAVFEDLTLKRNILREVEAMSSPHTVFASNTSSLPIHAIADGCARPENVVGMHYFSPVPRMPLLEVVRTQQSSDVAIATCVELGKRQNKTVIVVRDGPGFYTSRVLAPYMNEAAWLLHDGAAIEAIDAALTGFGFPLGPLALLDEVGIDVAAKVAAVMAEHFGERMAPPPGLPALKAGQRLGRKNQCGFYRYDRDYRGRRPVDDTVYASLGLADIRRVALADMAERCVLQMVNEAARCLGDGIVRSARDGDVGAVFGLGFPPFLGGPLRYADDIGPAQVVDRLQHFASELGARFEPAPLLLRLAGTGGTFHP